MSLVIIPRSTERIRHSKYVQPTSVGYTADFISIGFCILKYNYIVIDIYLVKNPIDINIYWIFAYLNTIILLLIFV